jgi:hypothetical protein
MDRGSLDPVAKFVMDKAFPGFWDADASSEDFRKQREQLQKFRVDHILIHSHSPAVCRWLEPAPRPLFQFVS